MKSFSRKDEKIDLLVIHETAGNTADGCLRTLLKKNCGVHYILDRDGIARQYVPLNKACSHARGVNRRSVGIEVVNPYSISLCALLDFETLDPLWWFYKGTDRRNGEIPKYVLPTQAQIETLMVLVPRICVDAGIPFVFPYKDSRKVHKKPESGIIAHRDQNANRADGRYLVDLLVKEYAE